MSFKNLKSGKALKSKPNTKSFYEEEAPRGKKLKAEKPVKSARNKWRGDSYLDVLPDDEE
jgi:hypothetical protein